MTSSSSQPVERGLDTMLLVYCVLQGHPGAAVSQQFLAHAGWFTSPLVLFEAKATLTKIYGVDPGVATQKLTQFATVPVVLLELDAAVALSAVQLADAHGLDLTDAVLLHLARRHGAQFMATEDQKFAQVCTQFGVTHSRRSTPPFANRSPPGKLPTWLPRACRVSYVAFTSG